MMHKIFIRISYTLFFMLLGIMLNAQSETPYMKGIICDEFGKPLSGVIVNSEKGENHALSDENGEYSLVVTDGSKYVEFQFIGFESKKVSVKESGLLNVSLKTDVEKLDELIRLGYSVQRRNEITGSVSTVRGEELQKSPVANLGMTFDGRLPGLFTKETSSELARTTTELYVHGLNANRSNGPLIVIDGVPTSYNSNQSMEYISPAEIESVTVLKDASTEALYGIEGANGVIVITTKRGQQGKLKVDVRLDESIQQVTTKPAFIGSAEYAALRNEAALNDGRGANFFYSDQEISSFSSGTNLYPNNNWYDQFMKKFAQMQRANVTVQGGTDQVQYFTNVNIMHQGSQFNTDHPAYDSNENFTWANVRSNVNAKLNHYLSAYLDIAGNIKRERTPGQGIFSNTIYSSIFDIPSASYGPVTPTYTDPTTSEVSGGEVVTTNSVSNPTYGMLNRSGFTRHTVTNIYAHFGLNLDMSFLTKGLNASGSVAYQTNSVNSLYTTQNYERDVRTSDRDTLAFIARGTDTDTPLSYSKGSSYYYYLTYNAQMNYDWNFGLSHVTGMGYMFFQNLHTSDDSSPEVLPYNRLHTGLEGTYAYDQKYLLKGDIGYSGSEAYPRGHRFAFTPSLSMGWIASRESFLKNIDWLSYLKLRASYGKTANDDCGLNRFVYLDNDTWSAGGSISYLRYIINENQFGYPDIRPEISKKQNYGIDLEFFHQLSLSVDLFKERMNNMVINASANIPESQGIPLGNYPVSNSGKFKNEGYDISVQYTKSFTKDLTAYIGGFVSYAKNTDIYSGEALKTSDYTYRKWKEGYSYGESFGYLVDYSNGNGFFNSQDEITNSKLTYSFGAPRVGDLKYKDLNKDGIINQKDEVPLTTGSVPRYYYGFSGGFSYKSFDFSFLFQGIGKYSMIESGIGIYGTNYDGVYGSLLRNAYTATRYQSGAKITAPALSLTTSTNEQPSDYYLYNKAYLRLKNIEVGYTLPANIARVISASKVRFILSAQNLFTWDKMKSDDFGPEGGYDTIPVYRVYNIGLSLQF